MKRVFMLPTPTQAALDTSNSIHQIVLQLQKALPAFGYELTENEAEADLVVGHAGQMGQNKVVDVSMIHGLYPTAHYHSPDWWYHANSWVTQSIRTAKEVTVPSEWVAHILQRDMGLDPTVISWAINPDDWKVPEKHGGYVLWNKTRADAVCDPAPAMALAKICPKQLFLSTFGDNPTPNVKITGRVSFPEMQAFVQHAAIYLATTRETFGISTVESMACGVPVLGYRYGGTADIVEHGVTGFLVEPGDIDGLKEGLEYCLTHRDVLGANARKRALAYTWERTAQQLAAVFDRAIAPAQNAVKVSCIIPVYNYGRFVDEAIESVKAQTMHAFECLIIDDGSTDNSVEVIENAIKNDRRFRLIKQSNQGVAAARNNAIAQARGDYICCLDADDRLGHKAFLQTLADALDADRARGIVYTGLTVMNSSGELSSEVNGFPGAFSFEQQLLGHNQVPTCNMFRKEAWRRVGGYRANMTPAEDANVWLRITAAGYIAEQIVTDGWFHYRLHENSLSSEVRTGKKPEPKWNNFPYVKDGNLPFAASGKPAKFSYPVRNYDTPLVSIIIPVGKGHERYLPEALDSVEYQTERNWECIVVNDTGKPLDLRGYAWAKVITSQGKGASAARNTGIRAAKAPLITFLDADDLFHQEFLEHSLKAFRRTGRYAYTDFVALNKEGMQELVETSEYDCKEMFHKSSMHSINIVMRKADALKVGLFDETMLSGWEDTDFFLKLAAAGVCGVRVPKALTLYRYQTGSLRETGETIQKQLKEFLYKRYADYIEGRIVCGCAGKPNSSQGTFNAAAVTGEGDESLVRVEYQGALASHSVRGMATGRYYGYRQQGDIFYVLPADIQAMPDLFTALTSPEYEINQTQIPAAPVPI